MDFLDKKDRIYNVKIKPIEKRSTNFIDFSISLFTLPTSVDLTTGLKNFIYNQKNLGSCVSNSIAWSMRYLKRSFNPSRLFMYYNQRLIDYKEGDNNPSIDDGTYVASGVKAAVRYGACPGDVYPYFIRNYNKAPPQYLYPAAYTYRIGKTGNVQQNIDSMKACLAAGYPFIFGFYIYSSFEDPSVDATGIVPYPDVNTETYLGGHSGVAVGYDDSTSYIKFANSYGKDWGDNGYGYIPYDYILNPDLTDEFGVLLSYSNQNLLLWNDNKFT